ncbi:Zinc finger A20 and AN1 domain-containing stress-associated protein [Quillaja saponaria]|uniref:Zinc finger A20 and AN1 domain-containing stress-associated protein n=1 Tax=Quillaja saponaria TaxID=32244 RepID=A0AAD7KS73_QUISA|nr:Zinc finger A20 and AN1 domain-containing stress-associated protein [Quillaja saponaria]
MEVIDSPDETWNDGTSYQPPESKLCANNCGFFGTADSMNLCSKCYRDFRIKEEHAASAKAAMAESLNTSQQTCNPPESKASNRCSSCNKKVGFTGFRCMCGSTFCGTHRHPENHDCTYDFMVAGRDAIAKANPLVKSDKVERF